MQVAVVPPSDVLKWWPLAQPLLQPAIDRTYEKEDTVSVLSALMRGTYRLWLCWDDTKSELAAAATTQVVKYPTGKVYLSILLLGGKDMGVFLVPLVEALEDYSSVTGCNGAEIQGRPGWTKLLARHGFYPAATAYERDLTNGQFQTDHHAAKHADSTSLGNK